MNIKKAVRLISLAVLVILLGGCSDKPSEPVSPTPPAPGAPVTVTMTDGKEVIVTEATTYEEIAPYLARTYTAEEIEKLKMEEPYKSYLAKYQEKLLPLGSVVYIPGADSLEMVVSRNNSLVAGDNALVQNRMPGAEENADYFLEKYPDGTGNLAHYKAANHQDIGLILHVGMESELEDRFLAGEMGKGIIAPEIKNQHLEIKNDQVEDKSKYEYVKTQVNKTMYTEKFPSKLLPIGSVVRLYAENGYPEEIIVIIGRMLYDETSDKQYIYVGYRYPEGVDNGKSTKGEFIQFGMMGIGDVLYIGMESPEEVLFDAHCRNLIEYFVDVNGNY